MNVESLDPTTWGEQKSLERPRTDRRPAVRVGFVASGQHKTGHRDDDREGHLLHDGT
jgi:hypothetical protein